MQKKAKAAAVCVPVALLLTVIGGMSLNLDFSTTTIGQIGDNIINNYLADRGIDLDEFKRLCDTNQVHEEFRQYCALIP